MDPLARVFREINAMRFKTEIGNLTQIGFIAVPVRITLSAAGKKEPFFGAGWGWGSRTELKYLSARFKALGNSVNGIVVVTSNVFVVDLDPKPGKNPAGALRRAGVQMPADTVRARTPSGGEHFYFRMPAGISGTHASLFERNSGIDSRGTGGFVYAPPSVVPGYGEYAWINAPWEVKLADAPVALIEYLREIEKQLLPRVAANGRSIDSLSEKQKEILFERWQQARIEGEKDPRIECRDRSRYDFRLVAWAIACKVRKEEIWNICRGIGKFAERGFEYFESTYSRAMGT
jgi:hypothetical protein